MTKAPGSKEPGDSPKQQRNVPGQVVFFGRLRHSPQWKNYVIDGMASGPENWSTLISICCPIQPTDEFSGFDRTRFDAISHSWMACQAV